MVTTLRSHLHHGPRLSVDGAAHARLELYWIPLGAGTRIVRTSGRIYEALVACAQRRPRQDLYHSALVACVPDGRYFIEMTPDAGGDPEERGVVGVGAVGSRLLSHFRVFRYEIRRWRDGVIADLHYAVDSPVLISTDTEAIRRVLDLANLVPTPVWGRDELRAGDMWNSNAVISWVLEQAGLIEAAGAPPRHGRAPGWAAGVLVAHRPTLTPIGAGRTRLVTRLPIRWPPRAAGAVPPERWCRGPGRSAG